VAARPTIERRSPSTGPTADEWLSTGCQRLHPEVEPLNRRCCSSISTPQDRQRQLGYDTGDELVVLYVGNLESRRNAYWHNASGASIVVVRTAAMSLREADTAKYVAKTRGDGPVISRRSQSRQ
jgi:hypothetical protein